MASVIVVGASSTSAEPSSPSAESRQPPLEHATVNRTRKSLRRSTNLPRKDANPASAGTTSSLIKRKQETTAQLPNKRPRQKNPEMGPAIVEGGEDNVDPAVLNVMNEFSKSKTRSASRTETPKIEVRLRGSKDMGDYNNFPPRKRIKPISPRVSPLPEDEDQGESQGKEPQPELEPELEAGQEGEQIEDGDQLEAEVDGEAKQPRDEGEAEPLGDEMFVKQTRPSQPVFRHIHGIARPTPSTISSNPQLFKSRLNRAREIDKLYDVMEEDEEGVQVSSNPSSTSLHRKQTINNLQAPQARLNVTRLPSKPWINADDEGFGYPDGASRAKKKDTAGNTSRKAPSRLEKPLRPPGAMKPAPAPTSAPAPRARAQQKSVTSRARRSPTFEPATQRRPATSPHRNPSPQRARTQPVEAPSESGTAEETDEDGHPMPPQPTVPMSRTAVVAMHQIMGRVGWTNRQKNWARHLAPGATGSEHGTPGTTSYGRQMFQYLTNLNRALNKIPKAPYFAKQAKYLVAHDAEHRKMFLETKKLLTKIREERLAPIGDSDRRANGDLEQRRGMVHDILHYLMPMLVLIVWTTFSLGGVEHDAEGHTMLSEEGTFTDITLGYVVKFSHWINDLMVTLELELSVRPFEDDSAVGKKEKDRARESFRDALDHWFLEFEEAQEAVDELATGGERRARQLEEDLRIKEALRREELKQEAETERRWREMAASTQRIARLPNPLQEKWERATGESQTPTASTSSGRSERALSTEARAAMQYPPWPIEDRLWLMGELRRVKGVFRRHNGQPGDEEMQFFADTLERPVEEVKLEIEAQKRACRALARERGLPLEPWAA